MIRFLGILTGAAIAVAALIVVVGIPEFPDEPDPQPVEVATPQPAAAMPPSMDIEPEPQAPAAPVEALPEPRPVLEPSEPEQVAETAEPEQVAETAEPELQAAAAAAEEVRWYAFWSPFRSELAANGFVAQLQRTTGLDYRVVKQKIGVYEVAFAYTDDADIDDKLARISAATGLDLPE